MDKENVSNIIRDRIAVMQKVDVFKYVPEDVLSKIALELSDVRVKKEEIIFRKGDEGNSMFIIVEGSVRVHVGNHVLTRLHNGKVFGEYALFDQESRSASITAEIETHLLELQRLDFTSLMEGNLDVMKGVLKLVLKRIREMNELERKLAHSYIKIQKQKQEIESQHECLNEKSAELEKKNKDLLKLNEEKHHLISVMAHDLRNPLTSSLCLADLFKTNPEDLSDDQVHSIEVIDNSLRRINRIINQILDINDIDNKSLTIKPQKTNLNVLLNEIIEIYRYAVAQKNIDIHFNPADVYVNVDRNYISLVLENLLSNAIKFSPTGKSIFINLKQVNNRAVIEIIDQGPGIDKEDVKKLFGKYQKPEFSEDDDNMEGMGLSIVKKYVDAMHGKVMSVSRPGKGATLIVEFDAVVV